MKKLVNKYLKLVKKIPKRHYWPFFIFFSLYNIVPYSEFTVTIFLIGYFKFEDQYRKIFGKILSPIPDIIKYGASVIFFLVIMNDTLLYGAIILAALWSTREAKKLKEE